MSAPSSGVARRVALLTAQAAALGLVIAWITVPANTLFLDTYGSGLLPVTYILSAGAGGLASVLLSRALERRALTTVASRVLAGMSAALTGAWLMLWLSDAAWTSFALLVVLPIAIPVGFMFVIGQAGALLDVRSLKVMYPRVIAGFAAGFTIGGLSAAPLLEIMGRTEHLLSTAAATAAVLLSLVLVTVRSFPAELAIDLTPQEATGRPRLGSLLRNRYVVLIMAFQMLSAIESQLLDFLVYDHAGRRYTDPSELATFVGRFSAIAYGADIVFLVVLAGLLMGRFGLRFGLFANSTVVAALVLAGIGAAVLQGSGATIVFLLIVGTRVSDMVLADGATRTSVGAAYQAVPGSLRTASQAAVESLAVPVAIGASGVILLIVRATVGTRGLVLPVIVVVVLVAWIVCALAVYRSYGVNLLATLRHRQLDLDDVALADAESLEVVESLVASTDPGDVRLGIGALVAVDHPSLIGHLERLVEAAEPAVRALALDLLSTTAPGSAAAVARRWAHGDPAMRSAALGTLSRVGDPTDAAMAVGMLEDPDADVRIAAASAVSRLGSDAERSTLRARIDAHGRSGAAAERHEAARLLCASPEVASSAGELMASLLADHDPAVVHAALGAVAWPAHQHLEPLMVKLLGEPDNAAPAADALVRAGAGGLVVADRTLSASDPGGSLRGRLAVRVVRSIGGPAAVDVLLRHVSHPDRDLGCTIISAMSDLSALGCRVDPSVPAGIVDGDVVHARRVLHAITLLDGHDDGVLVAALHDELDLVTRRLLAALSLRYGNDAIDRVAFQLAQPDQRVHAIALEWLEVALDPPMWPAVAVLEPGVTPAERLRRMGGAPTGAASETVALLVELACDDTRVWRRPWLRACAVQAIAQQPGAAGTALLERLAAGLSDGTDSVDDLDGIVRETLHGVLSRAAVR